MYKSLRLFFFPLLLFSFHLGHAQSFEQWFDPGAMRLDLVFTGTAKETTYAFEALRKEPYFSGSPGRLIDPFNYGDHKLEVKNAASGTLIFSQTYSTLFREWQTTSEADSLTRAYNHVLRFPWPKEPVTVAVFDRDHQGTFQLAWTGDFDPRSIYADPSMPQAFEVLDLEIHGPPESKVDILFLAEGYTESEMDKFLEDARRSADFIFSEEPFLSNRDAFNLRAVQSISNESGPDIPGEGIWKNTVLNASFYTFGIERYMTTHDYRRVCDVAANAHYDQIYILVNTDKYGGGGIYNFYSMSAADNMESRAVIIHEFGHAFGGLGDEYYNSEVAYNDFFNLEAEPWSPNLTTLVDFDLKWKSMIDPGTPIPTPAEETYRQTLGVYEGGGYVTHGVFRPMIDCRMHSNAAGFCPVCTRAIVRMIRSHTGL